MDFALVKAWLAQTSTRGALATVAVAGGLAAAGMITPEAAVAFALPAGIGLLVRDKATADQVAAAVQPALQAIAAHPTVDVAKAQAAATAAALLPTIEAKLPADAQTAVAAATLIAQAAAKKPA